LHISNQLSQASQQELNVSNQLPQASQQDLNSEIPLKRQKLEQQHALSVTTDNEDSNSTTIIENISVTSPSTSSVSTAYEGKNLKNNL